MSNDGAPVRRLHKTHHQVLAMPLQLFAHPFSSYCQKVLIALYENGTPFALRMLDRDFPGNSAELAQRWPLQRFPILVDDERTWMEASIIIEYLQLTHPGPIQLMPDDPATALDVRLLDRFFDNYISTPQQMIVFDAIRDPQQRDAYGVAQARTQLDTAYAWLDMYLAGRTWAVADTFSLADCGAAPFLFYADWTHAIAPRLANVHAYRARLLARPSVVRAVDEARPFRHYFPLGAPDRD
jgi:glutathione S-transferase